MSDDERLAEIRGRLEAAEGAKRQGVFVSVEGPVGTGTEVDATITFVKASTGDVRYLLSLVSEPENGKHPIEDVLLWGSVIGLILTMAAFVAVTLHNLGVIR